MGVDHIDSRFDDYKKKHGKDYPDASEHAKRKHLFKHNLRYVRIVMIFEL